MSEIECGVCPEGRLELRQLPFFPSPVVQRLGGYVLWGACFVAVLSLVLALAGFGALVTGSGARELGLNPAAIVGILAAFVGMLASCLFWGVIGALLTMHKATLQCNNCSATTPAS